jgi:hypothetical protein
MLIGEVSCAASQGPADEIKHVVMDLSGELTKNREATLKHIMAKQ